MGTLTSGGQLHLIGEIERQDIDYLMDFLSRHRIEILFLPFSYLNFLFNESNRWHQAFNHHLRHIITAGEQLKITSGLKRFLDSNPKLELHNHYGSTEMHVVTSYTLDASTADRSPIPPAGKPISNTRIYILDEHLNPVPVGVWGELFVCGSSEVLGYINNSRLNEKKLVKHEQLSTLNNNQRFYRSGDMGRWMEDGNIELRGRKDFLVKVRGFRVEPGEIESKILSILEVKECVVVDREDEKHQKYLVAYVVKENIDVKEIRRLIGRDLPQYMIPRFVVLESLPLMPNGKVDRAQLPKPEGELLDQYVAPADKVERKLVEIWAELLAIAAHNISIHADFFELGGHSLRATQMVAKIHKAFNVKVPLVEIFRVPTVSQLAEFIKDTGRVQFAALPLAEKKEYYPMSSVQRRLYVLHQLDKGSTSYNMPGVKIPDPGMDINREKFVNLLQQLIRRHESFRTSFLIVDEEPVQRIHDEVEFEIEYYDLQVKGPGDKCRWEEVPFGQINAFAGQEGEPATRSSQPATALINAFIRPFDLSQAPLLRAGLIEIGDKKKIVMLDRHHIINDGLSHRILVEEILALLREESLPPLKLQYKDYSQWQNSKEERKAIGKQGEFWLKQFEGEIPVLALPLDFARPAVQKFDGKTLTFEMGKAETDALRRIAAAEGATVFMVLITLFTIFLSKISNQEDIVIGTPVSGRRHTDLDPVIGMFVNTLALRNYPGGEKDFHTFLSEVKERILQAFDNQLYPFEDLVEELGSQVNRDTSRNPLFDVMVLLEDSDLSPTKIPGLDLALYENKTSKFDLTLQAVEGEKDIELNFEYSTSLFREETIWRLIGCFKRVVSAVVEDIKKKISRIEIISPQEKKQLLVDFNNTEAEYPTDKTIYELFEEQAERTPDHVALVGGRETQEKHEKNYYRSQLSHMSYISYKELNEKSLQLAHLLNEKGVKPDTIGAIMGERSIETIISIFGILKAGGAFLFIDPEYPEERVNYVLKDSKVKFLVDKSNFFGDAKEREELFILNFEHLDFELVSNFDIRISNFNSANLAYIIYTSGSTGKPKGVMVNHRSVVNLLFTLQDRYPFNESDTYLLKTSILFDVSITELFGWFMGGGRLVILGKGGEKDPQMILDTITRHHVTHINFVPSMFHAFLEILNHQNTYKLSQLRYIFLAGEALSPGLVNKFGDLNAKTRLENIYGPTEGTVYSSKFSLSDWDGARSIPIGAPLQNMKLHILNKDNHLQPVGIPGELCISGAGLARGYLNNSELTAEKFDQDLWDFQDYRDKKKKIRSKNHIQSYNHAIVQSCNHASMQYQSPIPQYPITPLSHSPIYRTGDLVRWLGDGNIEFLGRMDHQVKIRGYRIELGEIKSQLLKYDKIKEVLVIQGGQEPEHNYLCAYIVSSNPMTVLALKEYLSSKLPGYMIPSYFIMLEEIPLTRSGKVDRKALPEPDVKGESEYIAPRDELEKKLVELWSELLDKSGKVLHPDPGRPRVIGIDDNFFELGGHSLKASLLISRLNKTLNIKIPLAKVFRVPTIRGMSRYIKDALADQHTYADTVIDPAEKKEYYLLSSAQKRLYIVSHMESRSIGYNLPLIMELEGKPHTDKLEQSFRQLVQRHESFRTSFKMVKNEPVQQVHDEVEFSIENYDLTKGHHSSFIIHHSFVRPFDLSLAPLLRVGLIEIEEEKHLLMVDMHHVITDGISMNVLVREFMAVYAGKELSRLQVQYKDFSGWQNRWFGSEEFKKQETYWLKQFEHSIPALKLGTHFKNPTTQDGEERKMVFEIAPLLTLKIKQLISDTGTTLFIVLLAAYNILLAKYTGQDDIVVGTGIAGREHADLQQVIGLFINMLALRNRPHPAKTFFDFLQEVKGNAFNAYANQGYPYDDLVKALDLQGEIGRNPLFETVLQLQNIDPPRLKIPGLVLKQVDYEFGISRYLLAIYVTEREDKISMLMRYSTVLFSPSTARKLADRFIEVLEQVVKNREVKLEDIVLHQELIKAKSNVIRQEQGDFQF